MNERPIRALLIAEAASPELVSVPLEGWSHSRAISALTPAHTITQIRNLGAWQRAGVDPCEYTALDSERVAKWAWRIGKVLSLGTNKGWTAKTAMRGVAYAYEERLIWKMFGARIRAKEWDVVHRLIPLSPTIASSLAAKCDRAGVPFVVGPLNGGVPWPKGFDSARRREREWLSYVRGAYKLAPNYRSMREHAAALIMGSRDTFGQMPEMYRERCVYVPENAVDPKRFGLTHEPTSGSESGGPLRIAFVGRLVPYKGCDMLIEAALPLMRSGRVHIEVIGDGPEMPKLRAIVEREKVESAITFAGWIDHKELHGRLGKAQVFGFPSVREFGGAVVLEAMALGVVPIVLDYGGPGELVSPTTGFAVPIGSREEIVARFRAVIGGLAEDPSVLGPMRAAARRRVLEYFTWDMKARQVYEVYRWVLGWREKPDFGMPLGHEGESADLGMVVRAARVLGSNGAGGRLEELF